MTSNLYIIIYIRIDSNEDFEDFLKKKLWKAPGSQPYYGYYFNVKCNFQPSFNKIVMKKNYPVSIDATTGA